jgi:hypothetical protein
MSANIRQHKVLNNLPQTPEENAIYYVRTGYGFDMYVTDSNTGTPRSLNQQLNSVDFIDLRNEESFTVPKGTVVYNTGTGYKRAVATSPFCKKVIGLTAFDTNPGAMGLVQKGGLMLFNNTEWAVLTGLVGGISNSNYWLDGLEPGRLVSSSPAEALSPVWSLKMGIGLNNSTFSIEIKQSIKI